MALAPPSPIDTGAGRRLASYLVFPLILGTAVGLGVLGISAGYEPELVVAAISTPAAILIVILERLLPFRRQWLRSAGDLRADVGHLLVSNLLTTQIIDLTALAASGVAAAWLSTALGASLWPAQWPLLAQLALALVVGEFGQYWIHRLAHETDILWRLHATHHSARRLYWLNAARFHPFDLALGYLAEVIPLALLGCPPEVLALFVLFTAVHGLFQHANIELRFGPLSWIFSTAALHRWHHAPTAEESAHNYGANLIIWDAIFGTRLLPADRPPPEVIGIDALPHFPTGFRDHLLSPFRWNETVERSR